MFMTLLIATALLTVENVGPQSNTLYCYALERGWIAYSIDSPDLRVIRQREHARRPFSGDYGKPEISSVLSVSNVRSWPLSAFVVDNRLLLEFGSDGAAGPPSSMNRGGNVNWYRGECSAKDLFDGKVLDQAGKPANLFTSSFRGWSGGSFVITGKGELVSVRQPTLYGQKRELSWWKGDEKKLEMGTELCRIPCPFDEPFKIFRFGESYYYVTASGRLYRSACDKEGVTKEMHRVPLGFGTRVTAVVTDVRSKKVFLFTKTGYQELGADPKPPKERELSWESRWRTDDAVAFSHEMYDTLVADKRIEPVKNK